jgi:asparagine synthase (glutamine-hydrolysing)
MYLSGGLDSATILHFANKNADTPLPCFGVSFANPNYDESQDAKRLAKACGSAFQAVEATTEKMLEVLEDAVWHAEQVCINGQLPAKHLLSKYVSNAGFKVVLSGEGADEALWGYPHLKQDWLKTIPEKRRQIYESELFDINKLCKGIMLSPTSNSNVPAFLNAKMAFGDHIRPLLSSEGMEWHNHYRPREQIITLVKEKAQQYSPIELGAYLWSKLALSGYILRAIGDGMEMRHGIEGRPPFLDHLLFTQCVALPKEQKIHQGIEKYALREIMRPHLPQWVCDKAKHPFIAPPIGFFRDAKHRSWVKNHLLERPPPGISKRALEKWIIKATHLDEQQQDQLESVVFLLLSTSILQSKMDEHTNA